MRFLTGFSLAGIYPIGIKIVSDYYDKDPGKSLGYLVGALVLGTAFPHFLKTFTGTEELPWRLVIIATSLFAFLGGLLILLFVPNGPFRKAKGKFQMNAVLKVFSNKNLRRAAFGYFGHMWELYTFWAFVPVILTTYKLSFPTSDFNISLWSFVIIGIGGVSCVLGGYISKHLGVKKTASIALLLSGVCCLLFPLIFLETSATILLIFLCFWGITVVADSPLFSTLVAQNAPAEIKGTALTIVNSVGFAITILSIQLINYLHQLEPIFSLSILSIGPALGLWQLIKKKR